MTVEPPQGPLDLCYDGSEAAARAILDRAAPAAGPQEAFPGSVSRDLANAFDPL